MPSELSVLSNNSISSNKNCILSNTFASLIFNSLHHATTTITSSPFCLPKSQGRNKWWKNIRLNTVTNFFSRKKMFRVWYFCGNNKNNNSTSIVKYNQACRICCPGNTTLTIFSPYFTSKYWSFSLEEKVRAIFSMVKKKNIQR